MLISRTKASARRAAATVQPFERVRDIFCARVCVTCVQAKLDETVAEIGKKYASVKVRPPSPLA